MACLIAVTITSLFLFNRMTEPLLRFSRIFANIRQGKLPDPIELRKRDYLKREAVALNEMIAALRSMIGEIKRRQRDLSGTLEEVAEITSLGDPGRIAELVSTLSEQDKSLRESLARFQDPA